MAWPTLLGALGIVKTDIPFARDDANRFLPWVLALMVALNAFSICIGLTLGQWVSNNRMAFSDRLTIIIPPQPDSMQNDVANMMAFIEKQPGIAELHVLDKPQVTKLIEPWLGSASATAELPLPVIAEARMVGGRVIGGPDIKALQEKLTSMIAGTEIDAHEAWVEKFSRFTTTLQALSYSAAFFILAALAAMVIFTSQTALKLHRRTVSLLHSIGADDPYIARQFQWNACAVALQGAIPGTILGALLYSSLAIYAGALDTPLMPRLSFSPSHAIFLLLLPVVCAALALASARIAVLRQLRRVL